MSPPSHAWPAFVGATTLLAAGAAVSGCYEHHALDDVPVLRDARPPAPPRPDASPDAPPRDAPAPDAFTCPPDEPCECLSEGVVSWPSVWYCALGGDGLTSGADGPTECGTRGVPWGDRITLRARCQGRYTFCARVVSFSGCTLIDELCTTGAVTDESGRAVMRPPPGWIATGRCAEEALFETGGQTCVSLSWTTDTGERGSVELGCLAAFGPIGGGGGGRGAFGGDSGEWDF